MLLDLGEPLLSQIHATLAFKAKRLGDNANRQNAAITSAACDDGCRASARTAAHTRCDENHVCAIEVKVDLINGLFSGGCADLWPRACAKT